MAIRYLSGINVDSNTLFVDAANNRVGIGTASPTARLQVDGDIITGNGSTIKSASGFLLVQGATNLVLDGATGTVNIRTNSTDKLVVTNAGNVGIGTTSPSEKLHVVGQAIIDGGVGVASSGTLHIRQKGDAVSDGIAITSSNTISHRIWKDAGGTLNIGPSTLPSALVQTLAGNVGIGTTSPGSPLTVAGAGGSTRGTNGYLVHIGGTDGSVDPVRYMIGFSHGNTYTAGNVRAAIGSMVTSGGAGNLIFETGLGGAGQAERMRINGDGNVGIGTTSPSSILDASLSSGGTSGFRFKGYSDAGTPYLLSLGTETYPDVFQVKSVNGLVTMGVVGATGAAPDLVLQTNTTERMRITSAGNVGIGTTAPTRKLQITDGEVFVRFNPTIVDGSYLLGAADGKFYVIPESTFVPTMTFSSGNVGIGTTSPTAKLHSESSTTSYQGFFYNTNTTDGDGVRIRTDYQNNASILLNVENAGNDLFVVQGGAGGVGRVLIPSGNVGIGTTSPSSLLHLSNSVGPVITMDDASGRSTVFRNVSTSTAAAIGTVSNHTFQIITNNTSKILITEAGNVGIGTTSPTQKLSVEGNTDLGNSIGSTLAATYTTRLSGYALYYDASNRYGNYGVLLLNADSGWTASSRRFMITNGYNANRFAIIRSVDSTTDPALGYGGSVTSGTVDFEISSAGAATFGSSVTASSLIKSGGTSSQYLMADGSVSTLTNPVTGTGTTNSIPKWTSGSSIGDSIISDTSGVILIGGSVNVNGENTHIGIDATGGTARVGFVKKSGLQPFLAFAADPFLLAVSNGTTIAASNTFSTVLSIATSGAATFSSSVTATNLNLTDAGGGAINNVNGNLFLQTPAGTGWIFRNGASGFAEYMRLNASGNLSIGNTNDTYKLDVTGTGRFTSNVIINSDNTGVIVDVASRHGFMKYFLYSAGLVGANTGTDNNISTWLGRFAGPITAPTSVFQDLVIMNSGNVGIGTTNPGAKLHVSDANYSISSGDAYNLTVITTTPQSPGRGGTIGLGGEAGDGGFVYGAIQGAKENITFANKAGYLAFYTRSDGSNPGERMRISSAGNVGIGTTNPGYKLDVVAGANGTYPFIVRNAGNVEIGGIYSSNAGAGQIYLFNASTVTTVKISTIDSSYFNGGNVGIGTSNPGTKLTVDSGSTIATSRFTNSTTGLDFLLGTDGVQSSYTNIVFYSDSGNAQIWKAGSTYSAQGGPASLNIYNSNGAIAFHPSSINNAMFISTSGQVLINSTSMDGKLGINTATSTAYNPNAYNGNNASIRLTNGSAGVNRYTGIAFGGGGSTEAFIGSVQNASELAEIVFQTYNGSAYGERARITSAGLVAIGNTNPQSNSTSAVIDVGNTTGGTVNLRDTDAGASGFNQIFGGNGQMYFYAGSSGASSVMQFYTNDVERMRVNALGRVIIGRTFDSGAPFNLQVDGRILQTGTEFLFEGDNDKRITVYAARPLIFATTDIERMRITAAGNVGIGTTSADAKLFVQSSVSSTEPTMFVQSGTGAGQYGMISTGDSFHGLIMRGKPAAATTYGVTAGDEMSFFEYGGIFNFYKKDNIGPTLNLFARISSNSATYFNGGNVGIGTTSPTRGITINKTNEFASLNIVKANTTNQIVYLGTGSSGPDDLGILQLYDGGVAKVQLYTGGNSYFTGGSVGIGTTSPVTQLQVTSATNAVDVLRIGNTAGDSGSVQGVTHLAINHFNAGTNPSTRITAYQDSTSGWPGGMYFSTRSLNTDSAPVERMRITSGGNVGIATATPNYTLHVAGDVQIDAEGNAPSASYVPDGGFGLDSLVTSSTENIALGKPDVWLRIHVDGVAFVFPGYQEP